MSSVLLEEIRKTNRDAALVLENAGFRTDSDIQSLTRVELYELFPESVKIKLRRTIFDIIHKQRPIDVLIRDLKDFIPHEPFRVALTNNGVLVEYLRILKDMKTQMNYVQSFLDAHIGLLEELSKSQPYQESDKDCLSGTSTSDNHHPEDVFIDQSAGHPRRSERNSMCSPQDFREVKYQKIVTGKTFNADAQLMDNVGEQVQGWVQHRFIENNEDYQITIVFCPISSRIGTDVEAAMTKVKGGKPVILVLMHHAHEPKYTTSMRTWHDNPEPEVVLHVNVFYHETIPGLLTCQQNNDAVSKIQKKLLEYSILRSQDISENALCGAESGKTSSTGSNFRGPGGSRKGGFLGLW